MLAVHFYHPRYSNTRNKWVFGRPTAIEEAWNQKPLAEVITRIENTIGRSLTSQDIEELQRFIKLIDEGWTVYLVEEVE